MHEPDLSADVPLSIPAQSIRIAHDDSRRTRLLKDVLKASVALQENQAGSRNKGRAGLGIDGAPPRSTVRGVRSSKGSTSVISLAGLAASQEGDRACAELELLRGGDGGSELLQQCGERIGDLCARLQLAERNLKVVAGKAREPQLSSAAGEAADDIRIMDRPDEQPAVVRGRNDRIVLDFVAKHAVFGELEQFKDTIDKADDFRGLRAVIPARFKHHPNMVLLDDNVFSEPGKMSAAIWNTRPTRIADQMATKSTTSLGGTRLHARLTMQLEVATTMAPNRRVRLEQNRSAPMLVLK